MKKYLLHLIYILIIVLVGTGSFYIGRNSVKVEPKVVEASCKHGAVDYNNVLLEVNEYRLANDLKMFNSHKFLSEYAKLRANELNTQTNWTHQTNLDPYNYLRSKDETRVKSVSELMGGGTSACDVIQNFKDSPTHNASLLSPTYTQIGIGINDKIVVLELGQM